MDVVEQTGDDDLGMDASVVGSRGLHGMAAPGSVSERLAHRTHSSVLVDR
jgi:nucleotide-binding universal stress UspA family protein